MVERTEPLASLLSRRNAVRDFAEACGISTAAVSQWRQVPVKHAETIAALTGLSVADLRPTQSDEQEAA
jgi:DNA-binding transcriptional regulator YdaS (Cro superfamily)